ncbi:MAG: hypothetical protein DDT23_01356 [candidate division WS2 bacterium]|nr:hypothetical protein [Candidatus Lithacetigena glycinireducens]
MGIFDVKRECESCGTKYLASELDLIRIGNTYKYLCRICVIGEQRIGQQGSSLIWICPSCLSKNSTDQLLCECGFNAIKVEMSSYLENQTSNDLYDNIIFNRKMGNKERANFLLHYLQKRFPDSKEARQFSQPIEGKEQEKYKVNFEKQEKIQDKKQDNNVVPVAQCPYCEEEIPQDSVKCPYCAEGIKNYQKTEAEKNIVMPAQDVIESLKADPVPTEQEDALSTTISQSMNDHKKDLKNKLSKLEELFKDGILSEEEYRTKKEQMVDDFLSK